MQGCALFARIGCARAPRGPAIQRERCVGSLKEHCLAEGASPKRIAAAVHFPRLPFTQTTVQTVLEETEVFEGGARACVHVARRLATFHESM